MGHDGGQAVRRATTGVVVGVGCPRRCPCVAWEAWTDDAVVDSAVACSAVDGRSCVVGVVAEEIVPALVLVVDAGGGSLCMVVAPLTVS